jgi:hypothetical protein
VVIFDLCKSVCDIGHVLGLSWFMLMMSKLTDVMVGGWRYKVLWMSSKREREGEV